MLMDPRWVRMEMRKSRQYHRVAKYLLTCVRVFDFVNIGVCSCGAYFEVCVFGGWPGGICEFSHVQGYVFRAF